MELYILRHGIATEKDSKRFPNDADRPLTAEGQKKTLGIARRMKHLGLGFDLILSSPFARARQTAEMTASVLGCKSRLRFSEHLTPEGSKRALVQHLNAQRRTRKRVLLVGHEPYLSQFISMLLIGKPTLSIDFKKGGLCKLKAETLRNGRCATLQFLAPPKLML